MKAQLKKYLRFAVNQLGLNPRAANEYIALRRAQLDVETTIAGGQGAVGLIGCGRQGSTVAASVKRLAGWAVTDLFDVNEAAARSLASRSSPAPTVHASERAFLDRVGALDVVAIATTAAAHFPLARAAIEAGARAVLVEKPVTNRLADADALRELAERHRCRVAVNHTRRYIAAVPGLKRLISDGAIGPARSIHFLAGRAGFAMIGTHLFDLARWLFDSDIVQIRAELDADLDPTPRADADADRAGRCEGRLANGVRISLDLSGDVQLRQLLFVIACENGRLEVDEKLGRVRLIGAGQRVWEAEYPLRGALDLGIARAIWELGRNETPRCTIDDGRAALEAAIACHVSAREGSRWVSLPLADPVRAEEYRFA